MTAATTLREARLRAGLTQVDLARYAGTSQPVISAYENGARDPSTATLARMVAATGARLELRVVTPPPSDLPPAVGEAEHAARLVDVLLLADAIPHRARRGRSKMPRLDSRR